MSVNETKKCVRCKQVKPINMFAKDNRRPGGKGSWCKACHAESSGRWAQKNVKILSAKKKIYRKKNPWYKIKQRNTTLKREYDITIDDYDRLYEQQNGECAICGKSVEKGKLNIDHDHKTNKVRGLLCNQCNQALGLLKDNVELLNKARGYLNVQE